MEQLIVDEDAISTNNRSFRANSNILIGPSLIARNLTHKASENSKAIPDILLSKSFGGDSSINNFCRASNETSSIKYSGYLWKRSNKPFQNTISSHEAKKGSNLPQTSPIHITSNFIEPASNYNAYFPNTVSNINNKHNPHVTQTVERNNSHETTTTSSRNLSYHPSKYSDFNPDLRKHREHEDIIQMASDFFACDINAGKALVNRSSSNVRRTYNSDTLDFSINSSHTRSPQIIRSQPIKIKHKKTEPIVIGNSKILKRQIKSDTQPMVHKYDFAPTQVIKERGNDVNTNKNHDTSFSSQTSFIDPKDGHIWRSKYCILSDNVLYFYHNADDGNSIEAQKEREAALNFTDQSSSEPKEAEFNFEKDHLGKSPIPRNPFLTEKIGNMNREGSFIKDSHVMWEKRVALDRVESVRSAEAKYGEMSFELVARELKGRAHKKAVLDDRPTNVSDRLILRANSIDEMNEWLFQFHRSLASFIKNIVHKMTSSPTERRIKSACVSVELETTKTTKESHLHAYSDRIANHTTNILLSHQMSHAQHRIPRNEDIMALSHGHGRNGLHRQRIKQDSIPNSIFKEPGEGSSPETKIGIQKSLGFNTFSKISSSNPQAVEQTICHKTEMKSSLLLDNSNGTAEFSSSSSTLAIKKETIISTGDQSSNYAAADKKLSKIKLNENDDETKKTRSVLKPGKYIPPHLRPKNKTIPKKIKPAKAQNFPIESQEISVVKRFETNIVEKVTPNLPMQVSKKYDDLKINQYDDEGFRLGGCADPKISVGSILENVYIPRGASKVGRISSIPYGYIGGPGMNESNSNKMKWEIGAVCECGIRDSNEDAYLVINDIFGTSSGRHHHHHHHHHHVFEDLDHSSLGTQGMFAIFDGHCGNQAARFVAEKFPSIYAEESKSFVRRSDISEEERIEEIMQRSMSRLDSEFCHLCTAEGREWESGTTAIVALIINDTLYVAGLGDSNGVLCLTVPTKSVADKDDWSVLESVDDDKNPPMDNEDDNESFASDDDDENENENENNINIMEEENNLDIFWKQVVSSHSPSRVDEKERIRAANGWVTTEKEIAIASQLNRIDFCDEDVIDILKRCFSDRFNNNNDDNNDEKNLSSSTTKKSNNSNRGRILQISRVCGELAVSRAIGDRDFKAAFNYNNSSSSSVDDTTTFRNGEFGNGTSNVVGTTTTFNSNNNNHNNNNYSSMIWESPLLLPYPENHNRSFKGDLVSAIPDVNYFSLDIDGKNHFLVLACDGLWDVMDFEDAARVTSNLLFEKGWSAKKAAVRLAEIAMHLGSSDNITVLVIRFIKNEKSK